MGWITPDVVQDEVFEVTPKSAFPSWAETGYEAELKPVSDLTKRELADVSSLQGRFATTYLKTIYKSDDTYVLLIRQGSDLAAILWLVPGTVMRRRYSFVPSDASAIISCATSVEHRGHGLYPRGIENISASGLAQRYFIWAHKSNGASLRGIEKAGGRRIGEFVRRRWLRGLIAKIDYREINEQ